MTSAESDLQALRAFEADLGELERLQSLGNRFNVFETAGMVTDEAMHSNMLAFLLDPGREEGPGEVFLKRFLQRILEKTSGAIPSSSLETLDGMDLTLTNVRREYRSIDILLTSEEYELAVIIENKVWSTEHSEQLERYLRVVKNAYSGWTVLCVYLTPDGNIPSHEQYSSLGYGAVCDIVDEMLEDPECDLTPEVRISADHYARMVRRKLLGDPEVTKLAQEIYHKHKRAVDIVYANRPDFRAQLRPVIEELVQQNPELALDVSDKGNIRFAVKDWDVPAIVSSTGWTPSKRILLFQATNYQEGAGVHLYMGPGPEETRRNILGMAERYPEIFLKPRSTNAGWVLLFSRPLLEREAYYELDEQQREQELRRKWQPFVEEDLPRIDEAVKSEAWFRESGEPDDGA